MEKIFYKSFKFRLEPNKEQQAKCVSFAGAVRYVYNFALGCIKDALDNKQKIPSYNDAAKLLTTLKKDCRKKLA